MQRVRFYVGIVLGIVLAVFALQNMQATPVHLLLWTLDLSLMAIVFGSAALGAIVATLWMMTARWRKARRRREDHTAAPPPDSAPTP